MKLTECALVDDLMICAEKRSVIRERIMNKTKHKTLINTSKTKTAVIGKEDKRIRHNNKCETIGTYRMDEEINEGIYSAIKGTY